MSSLNTNTNCRISGLLKLGIPVRVGGQLGGLIYILQDRAESIENSSNFLGLASLPVAIGELVEKRNFS